MGELSEDESSDSSSEFLVPADKIDLSSSFFNESAKVKKSNPKKKAAPAAKQKKQQQPQQQLSDDSDDDQFDYANDNFNSAELLSQVLKNLEKANNQTLISKDNQSKCAIKKDGQQSTDSKGKDLSNEINDLLLQGESAATLSKQDEDEVEESKPEVKDYKIPEKGIQIQLPGENVMYDRKKKKQRDLQKVLQSKINQRIRTTQNFIHKVGLLCWIAHGFYMNKLSNDPDLLGICLSLISQNNYPKERPDLKYLERFTKWFGSQFTICLDHKEGPINKELLIERVSEKKIYNYVELVLLYIATIRGMGINCRLVVSLRAPALKPRPDQLFRVPTDNDTAVKKEEKSKKETDEIKEESEKPKISDKNKKAPAKVRAGKKGKTGKEPSVSPTKITPENSRHIANAEARKKAAAILKGKSPQKDNKASNSKSEENTGRSLRSTAAKKIEYMSDGENDSEEEKTVSIAQKIRKKINKNGETKEEKNIKGKKRNPKSTANKKRKHSSSEEMSEPDEEDEFSTDDEYVDKKPKKKSAKIVNKGKAVAPKSSAKSKKSSPNKLLSSDDEEVTDNSFNVWIEVYVESEESWICVDILEKKIHCVSEIYKKAGNPVLYILAWNSSNTVKDVTRRYCPHWLTDTRKKRVDEKWWADTLRPWQEKKTAISKAEDEQLLTRELEQPLPKTLTECKGHPLYVLTRHLLKFEALYPPDAVPLGHLKTGEAIYSRHCVHTLMSRERWVKKARVVKPAQEAYKIVKSMPKYDKLSGQKIRDQPLELFGKWQTMPYEPPEVIDGVVPRNEYGNVDLFKMCMLPKGGAYVNLPGLNRIARKLNVDCAPACVGFTFGTRGALPAFEGFVVAKEHEDTIREAWEEEQIEAQKRAIEKREKRIYGNWKKLIKGLLIKKKLAAKYNFGEDEDAEDDKQTKKKKPTIPIEVPTISRKPAAKKEPKMKKKAGLMVKILKTDSEGEDDDDDRPKPKVVRKKPPPKKKPVKSDSEEEEIIEMTKKKTTTNKRPTTNKKINKVDSDEESLELDDDIDINKTRSLRARNANKTFKEPSTDEDEDEEEENVGKKRKPMNKKTTDRGAKLRDAVKQALAGDDSADEWKSDDAEDHRESDSDFEEDNDKDARPTSRGVKRGKQETGNSRKKVKR